MLALPKSNRTFALKQSRRSLAVCNAKGFGAPSAPKPAGTVKPVKEAKATAPKKTCPCGSGVKYQQCCEVHHRGGTPATPEATLRARFTAYVLGQEGFLVKTFHPDYHAFQYGTEKGGAQAKIQQDVATACTKFTFSALDIKKVNQPNDTEAFIEFTYRRHDKAPEDPRFKPQAFVPKWLRNQKSQLEQTISTTPTESVAPAEAAAGEAAAAPASGAAATPASGTDKKNGVLMAECSKFVLHEGMWKFAEFSTLEVDDSMIQSVTAKAQGNATTA